MPSLLMVTTVSSMLHGFLLPFAKHFRDRGFRVDAMASGVARSRECVAMFDNVWEVAWSRNPLNPRNLWAARRRVREVAAGQGYDLIHVHTPVAAFVTRLALRRLRGPQRSQVIYTAHGFHFYRGGRRLQCASFRALEKLAGRWTDYLVVINREDEEAARRLLPPERVRYMPGIGLDLRRYAPGAVTEAEVARVRHELGLEATDRLFLMIAEFNPEKRHRDALAAFARLNRPATRLAFAGTGRLVEEMRRLAGRLGVAKRVHFLGARRDIPALVRASVAVLLPSEREGLSRSLMESLSLGVPVVGTRVRGIVDLLEDECGLLVPVGNATALAESLAWILDHQDESQAMGRRGRERMMAYDLQKIIGLHEALYEEALRRPEPVVRGA
jgi:glycosyltransferase involved in cell wall biosynthesis